VCGNREAGKNGGKGTDKSTGRNQSSGHAHRQVGGLHCFIPFEAAQSSTQPWRLIMPPRPGISPAAFEERLLM
jgi:hypothetical protein